MGNITWNGECLFNNDRDDRKYDNAEDGKGSCGGADDGGESNNDGRNVVRGPSSGGMGHRTSIVGPHATAAIIDNNDDNDRRRGGGASCPPPLWSIPSRRTPLVVVDVTDRSRWQQHGGVRGVVIRVVEEKEVSAVVLVCQVPIHPGVEDGGRGAA